MERTSTSQTLDGVQRALFADLAPAQVVAIERFLASVRGTGRCVAVTDLDEMLTAFSGNSGDEDTIEVLADYLSAGALWWSEPTAQSSGFTSGS